jgi:hypothetical protein
VADASNDPDVAALVGVLLLLNQHRLDASRIVVGRIQLELSPKSQLEGLDKERHVSIPYDASGGRLKS